MTHYINAGNLNDILEGDVRLVTLEDNEICLTRVEGHIRAFSNTCPHEGGPLNEGFIDGTVVTCPWHNAEFDMCNGHVLDGPTNQDLVTYPIEIRGEEVYIALDSEAVAS